MSVTAKGFLKVMARVDVFALLAEGKIFFVGPDAKLLVRAREQMQLHELEAALVEELAAEGEPTPDMLRRDVERCKQIPYPVLRAKYGAEVVDVALKARQVSETAGGLVVPRGAPGWPKSKDGKPCFGANGKPLGLDGRPWKDPAGVSPSTENAIPEPAGPKPSPLGLLESLPMSFREAVARFGADAIRQAARAGKIIAESDGTLNRGVPA